MKLPQIKFCSCVKTTGDLKEGRQYAYLLSRAYGYCVYRKGDEVDCFDKSEFEEHFVDVPENLLEELLQLVEVNK